MNLDTNRYKRNFIKDKKLIVGIMAIILIWVMIYLFTLYKPVYKSKAKVLIRDLSKNSYLVQNSVESEVQPLTMAGNPILTQLEILKSFHLSHDLVEYIDKNYPDELKDVVNKERAVKRHFKAKSKTGTDTIDIYYKADDPHKAQDLLNTTLKAYEDINLSMSKKTRTQRLEYINQQFEEIKNKLLEVRTKIKNYKQNNKTINIDDEIIELVKIKSKFDSQLENIKIAINSTDKKIKQLSKNLSLSPKEALNSVALGSSNQNLLTLRESLNEATQQYAFDSINLSKTNPKMVALQNRINTINNQIEDQVKLTLGKSAKKNQINILDPIRAKFVDDLVSSQVLLVSLKAQELAVQETLDKINSKNALIPDKEFNLNNLIQTERNLSMAYDEISVKQMNAKIKEAETVSNIVIIDDPNLPISKSFPKPSHVIILGIMLGGMIGLIASIIKTNYEDVCEDSDSIIEVTKSSILGIIPWVTDRSDNTTKSVFDFAFKNIASNLILKCNKNKVVVFTSSVISKNKATSVYDIADSINKIGQSVVIIDTDLRSPAEFYNSNEKIDIKTNLSDLIIDIESRLKNNLEIKPEYILQALTHDKNKLYIIGNKITLDSSYEHIGSNAFKIILSTLRDNFDWVLINTPAASITPEFLMVSKLSDAVVLLANYKVTYSALNRITKLLSNANIPILGVIIREQGSILEKDFAESINRLDTDNKINIK